jgi:3-deoxy-D-manno-octulosonate 8-phosphate phosphatase (KDO 8-P phosphatase)
LKKPKRILEKAGRIRFLLLDVDGVLTDGTIYLDSTGREMKAFNIYDGAGIDQVQKRGIRVGLVTGRSSPIVEIRARELEIAEVHQGAADKLKVYDELIKKYRLTDLEMAYMGDDLIDLPVLRRVGLAVATANAHPLVKKQVDWVTQKPGGRGAVREVTDLLLAARSGRTRKGSP